MVQHNANAVLKTVSLTQLLPGCTAPIARSTKTVGEDKGSSQWVVVRKGARHRNNNIGDDKNRTVDGAFMKRLLYKNSLLYIIYIPPAATRSFSPPLYLQGGIVRTARSVDAHTEPKTKFYIDKVDPSIRWIRIVAFNVSHACSSIHS